MTLFRSLYIRYAFVIIHSESKLAEDNERMGQVSSLSYLSFDPSSAE